MTDEAARPVVLVAEDEPLASMAMRAQLDALGLEVLGPARNGEEAVALGSCFPVDSALFDFRMPRRSGLEAAHELFQLAPTPVILLTGVGEYDLPDPIPRPPIFALLRKPAGLDDLRGAMAAARSRFEDWVVRTDSADLVAAARADRAVIARAVRAHAGNARLSDAATRFIEDARADGRPLLDAARRILAER